MNTKSGPLLIQSISLKYPYTLTFIIILLQAFTVVLLKLAAINSGTIDDSIIKTFNLYFLISLFLFGLRAIFWQIILLKNPISIFYPILSLNYIFIISFSYFLFKETITIENILGTIIIIIGVYIISRK